MLPLRCLKRIFCRPETQRIEISFELPWSVGSWCMPKEPPCSPEPKALASAWPPSSTARSIRVPATLSTSIPVVELAAHTLTVLPWLKRIGMPLYCLTRMPRHIAPSPRKMG
ncbi:hypothetical protein D3C71_1355570 [compost metagenome]